MMQKHNDFMVLRPMSTFLSFILQCQDVVSYHINSVNGFTLSFLAQMWAPEQWSPCHLPSLEEACLCTHHCVFCTITASSVPITATSIPSLCPSLYPLYPSLHPMCPSLRPLYYQCILCTYHWGVRREPQFQADAPFKSSSQHSEHPGSRPQPSRKAGKDIKVIRASRSKRKVRKHSLKQEARTGLETCKTQDGVGVQVLIRKATLRPLRSHHHLLCGQRQQVRSTHLRLVHTCRDNPECWQGLLSWSKKQRNRKDVGPVAQS